MHLLEFTLLGKLFFVLLFSRTSASKLCPVQLQRPRHVVWQFFARQLLHCLT